MSLCLCLSSSVFPDRCSSSQRCRVERKDQGRRSVRVRGAGGEDHPDAGLVAEREARPRRPAQRRRRGRRNMRRLLFSGLDRTNTPSFTPAFNHAHTWIPHAVTHRNTPPPLPLCAVEVWGSTHSAFVHTQTSICTVKNNSAAPTRRSSSALLQTDCESHSHTGYVLLRLKHW